MLSRSLGSPLACLVLLPLLGAAPSAAQTPPQNLLLIVLDDLGQEQVAAFGLAPGAAPTPALDRLAAQGVRFAQAWANPVCSPTRATLLTGRYGFRTGIGRNVRPSDLGLAAEDLTLPELLSPRYESAAVGKWHLAGEPNAAPHLDHPRESGFDHYAGALRNLADYFDWEKTEDGISSRSSRYQTSDLADEAIEQLGRMREPWLLYLAFNAPHAPYHAPPPELFGEALPGPPDAHPREHYRAALQALDRELGRVLSALSEDVAARTTIAVIGDNGSPPEVAAPPFGPAHAKNTLFEGGIRVPLIVASPRTPIGLRGASSDALVNSVDVFATLAELAGAPAGSIDGVSLVPYLDDPGRASLRGSAFAEKFAPNGFGPHSFAHRALRNDRYKLIREGCADRLFFDLRADPFEQSPLAAPFGPEQLSAYRELRGELGALVACPCESDADGDAVCDGSDNCVEFANPSQVDSDADGFGNACDADFDNSGRVSLSDYRRLRAAFPSGPGDPGYDPALDLTDGEPIGVGDLVRVLQLFDRPPGPSGLLCGGTPGCGAR